MSKSIRSKVFASLISFVFLFIGVIVIFYDEIEASDETVEGIEVILFLVLLLFALVVPAFKKRERTYFHDDN